MKTEGHKFTLNGGTKIVAGKPRWPHHMRIAMTRQIAFELIRDLLAQLEWEDNSEVRIAALGEIVRDAEDDFDWANK